MTGRWSAGGDHAMTTDITSPAAEAAETALFLGEDWFDPLEAGVRTRIRSFIEELLEAELEAALGRKRYARGRAPETEPSADAARSPVSGHRHGHRERTLMGTFGAVTICVPRARLATPEGGTTEWRNASIPAYQRLTRRAEALIAGAYNGDVSRASLCGTGVASQRPTLMSGTRAALPRATLLQEHLPQTRDHIGQQVGLLGLRREQNEISEAFDHHRRKLPHVGLAALQAPLHELVDVTMQAVRHLAPLSLSRSNIADKSLQVQGRRMKWAGGI